MNVFAIIGLAHIHQEANKVRDYQRIIILRLTEGRHQRSISDRTRCFMHSVIDDPEIPLRSSTGYPG